MQGARVHRTVETLQVERTQKNNSTLCGSNDGTLTWFAVRPQQHYQNQFHLGHLSLINFFSW